MILYVFYIYYSLEILLNKYDEKIILGTKKIIFFTNKVVYFFYKFIISKLCI
jgi:hypothetical protein